MEQTASNPLIPVVVILSILCAMALFCAVWFAIAFRRVIVVVGQGYTSSCQHDWYSVRWTAPDSKWQSSYLRKAYQRVNLDQMLQTMQLPPMDEVIRQRYGLE